MSLRKVATGIGAVLGAMAIIAWSRVDSSLVSTLEYGAPEMASVGALAFGPENILFIGDTHGAAVFAVEVERGQADHGNSPVNVDGIDRRIAQMLGTRASEITIHDMAVHPGSQNVYLSVSRGDQPVLIRVTKSGQIEEVSLENVRFSRAEIKNAPAADARVSRRPARTFTVTDLAYLDGEVYVAGLSNEEFASNFRRIEFPFGHEMKTTSLEIYHVSHGQDETHAPVQTFAPVEIDGKLNIVAAYTCTPLVSFVIDNLTDGEHVVGTTIAELGAGNRPLDIVPYERDGKQQILIANSRHPLMRMDVGDFADAKRLVNPSRERGVPFEALSPVGVVQLADLNDDYVVAIQRDGDSFHLRSLDKGSL